MTRSILYLTGTRADFGLMLPTLQAIAAHPKLTLQLCVTGMHLSQRFGYTVEEVRVSGLDIGCTLPVDIDADSGIAMARAAAAVGSGLAAHFETHRPDVLILLGDRWEMLSAALCATLAGVPILHLCGGDRSGSVDDAIRHAVSKLAHMHGVATEGARERLLRMGEDDWRIHVVGMPGLVGLREMANRPRLDVAFYFGLDPERPIALVLFHPVVQDSQEAGEQMSALLNAVTAEGLQALCLMPNADAGNSQIREVIKAAVNRNSTLRKVTHLPRVDYVSLLAVADVMVGNSSSGIIEAATFGTPVVNVGDRQNDRERNAGTFDCQAEEVAIRNALRRALQQGRSVSRNIYGDGRAHERVTALLASQSLDRVLTKKRMTY